MLIFYCNFFFQILLVTAVKSFYQSTEDEAEFKVFISDHLSPEYAIHKEKHGK